MKDKIVNNIQMTLRSIWDFIKDIITLIIMVVIPSSFFEVVQTYAATLLTFTTIPFLAVLVVNLFTVLLLIAIIKLIGLKVLK